MHLVQQRGAIKPGRAEANHGDPMTLLHYRRHLSGYLKYKLLTSAEWLFCMAVSERRGVSKAELMASMPNEVTATENSAFKISAAQVRLTLRRLEHCKTHQQF